MRVANTTVSATIIKQLEKLNNSQIQLQNQVATGQRVTNLEDDPSAVGRVLGLQSQLRSISQYSSNADRALQISQSTYDALQSMKDISDRVSEIATLSTGVLDNASLEAYASELDQLIEQGLQTANSTLGNDYMFAGTATDTAPYVATRDADGNITAISYTGNTDQASINLSETSSVTPGASGDTNTGLNDMLNSMIALRDALNAGDTSTVPAIEEDLIGSEDQLISAIADQGGVQLRIEVLQTEQTTRSENIQSLISSEAEADLATTLVNLSEVQTAYEAALQTSASILKLSLLDYIH